MNWQPLISLIVPTHNRAAMLPRLLDALAAQTYPAHLLELVLVADGCVDDTPRVVRRVDTPFPLTLLELPGRGPAAARNAGAARSRGDLLIFFDDDIEVSPDFVAAHLRAHQEHDNMVALGHLPLAGAPQGYFDAAIRAWWREKFFTMRRPGYRFGFQDLFSGNVSLRPALFQEAGGFDLQLRTHEDYEFGLRLLQRGAIFSFVPDAVGVHHDRTDLDRSLQRRRMEGEADVHIAHLHPEVRNELPLAHGSFSFFSRVLRFFAFHQPATGDAAVRLLRRSMDWLERFWMHGRWQRLLHHLLDYWYWRGVAETAGSSAAVRALFAVAAPPPSPVAALDLDSGLDAAGRRLDELRPESVHLRLQGEVIGEIPAQPGRERLRGVHLRPWLRESLSYPLLLSQIESHLGQAGPDGFTLPPAGSPTAAGRKMVIVIDLEQPLPDLEWAGYDGLYLLARLHGRPLGTLTFTTPDPSRLPAAELRRRLLAEFAGDMLPETVGFPPPSPAVWPPFSVVICTRDRPEQLAGCLEALLAQDYPDFELIVVDNAPADDATLELTAELPVRYERQPRPGLDWARNKGIAAARYPLVAFTDDDARPDPGWLRALAQAFAAPEVMAVTGLVLPQELDTAAQELFEFEYGGMGHGFKRRFFRRAQMDARRLLWASGCGVGANMAFRRELFDRIGGFDTALDVGTPSGGGGDVEMFHRVIAGGNTLLYEPAALVWHRHRREIADLRKLVGDNGRSFGAYLLTCARRRTVPRRAIAAFALRDWLWGWLGQRLLRPRGFPRRLIAWELLGALRSPFAYRAARRHARAQQAQPEPPPLAVSVIIPAHNAVDTLADTLESLCEQIYPYWEAIIVDDGSTDETAAVAARFAAADDRFRILSQPQQGGGAARNQGLAAARFEWLLFLDADDWLLPRHLQRLIVELRRRPDLDVVHAGWTRVLPDGTIAPPSFAPDYPQMFALFTQTCAFQLNAALARRERVTAIGGFAPALKSCQDWDFWQRLARTGVRFGGVRELLARYRTRPGTVSQQALQLLQDGLNVIDQGHAPDPAAESPFAAGRDAAELPRARLQFASWPAGLLLGQGEDARAVIAALRPADRDPDLDPQQAASFIFEAAPLARGWPAARWAELWPQIGENVERYLGALGEQIEAPAFGAAAMGALAELIAEGVTARPFTIGHMHAAVVEITTPLQDIPLPPEVAGVNCLVLAAGAPLGTLTAAVAGCWPAAAQAEAIAVQFGWAILGRFFAHTLYPRLRPIRQSGRLSWWREDCCLSWDGPAVDTRGEGADKWAEFHDAVGWTLFLQELWGLPDWSEDDFYDPGPAELAPETAVQRADAPLTFSLLEPLPPLRTSGEQVTVTLLIGGLALPAITIAAPDRWLSARSVQAALTRELGVALIPPAVRGALLGKPLDAPATLRARLLARNDSLQT